MRVSDRKKGVNVQGTALVVHGVIFDCGECLGSSGWVESCGWWFVTQGISPIGPWPWCQCPITQSGWSVCMQPEAGYMCFTL